MFTLYKVVRRVGLTVCTFQRRIDLSSEPEAITRPSGLQAIVEIPARCPSKTWITFPVEASQILIVASAPTHNY